MRLKGIFLFMGILCASMIYGQSESSISKILSFSGGYKTGMLRDNNFSPLNYHDRGPFLGLTFERHPPQRKRLFYAEARYSRVRMQYSNRERFASDYLQGQLSVGLLQSLSTSARNKWLLGGGYHLGIHYLEWYEDERGDQDAFSFLATHSLLLRGRYERVIREQHLLSFDISLPLLTLLVRPPYNGSNIVFDQNADSNPFALLTDGDWVSPLGFTEINSRVAYRLPLNKRWSFTGAYQFSLRTVNINKRWAQFQNLLSFNLNYSL